MALPVICELLILRPDALSPLTLYPVHPLKSSVLFLNGNQTERGTDTLHELNSYQLVQYLTQMIIHTSYGSI